LCARAARLRRPRKRRGAGGGSKVVVLTQIPPPPPLSLSLSLLLCLLALPALSLVRTRAHFLSPCDNTDNGNVTCARPPAAGNTAMQTRMQIHLGMHFNANYERRSEFQRDSLVKSKTRCHLALPIARFGCNRAPAVSRRRTRSSIGLMAA